MAKIVLKDRFKSTISCEEIQKCRKQSKSASQNNYNLRITNVPTDVLISQGAERMKKDGFKIATEKTRDM